ncbi:MAG: hypothetical protein DCC57_25115 [Chloroflexi bacterium]|nr:MAG: hypothetical protein DCC57_25115 [Chloroflexota bacterium]
MAQCTAQSKRTGEQCRRHAVTGYSVCQVHGAGSPHQGRPGGAPPTTGRYSLAKQKALAAKVSQYLADPAPGDLRAELALLRALLQTYLDRLDLDALLDSTPDEDDGAPTGAEALGAQIQAVYGMVDAIAKLVERIARILATTALTQAELQLIQVAFLHALPEFLPDPDQRRAFVARVFGQTRQLLGPDPQGD